MSQWGSMCPPDETESSTDDERAAPAQRPCHYDPCAAPPGTVAEHAALPDPAVFDPFAFEERVVSCSGALESDPVPETQFHPYDEADDSDDEGADASLKGLAPPDLEGPDDGDSEGEENASVEAMISTFAKEVESLMADAERQRALLEWMRKHTDGHRDETNSLTDAPEGFDDDGFPLLGSRPSRNIGAIHTSLSEAETRRTLEELEEAYETEAERAEPSSAQVSPGGRAEVGVGYSGFGAGRHAPYRAMDIAADSIAEKVSEALTPSFQRPMPGGQSLNRGAGARDHQPLASLPNVDAAAYDAEMRQEEAAMLMHCASALAEKHYGDEPTTTTDSPARSGSREFIESLSNATPKDIKCLIEEAKAAKRDKSQISSFFDIPLPREQPLLTPKVALDTSRFPAHVSSGTRNECQEALASILAKYSKSIS